MPPAPTPRPSLATPLHAIKGIGPRRAAALAQLGPKNLGQLVAWLPHRHERHEPLTPIAALVPSAIVTATGTVTATRVALRARTPRFQAVLIDHTGRLDLIWYNALYARDSVRPGVRLRVSGKATKAPKGPGLQIANPQFTLLPPPDPPDPPDHTEPPDPIHTHTSPHSPPSPSDAPPSTTSPALTPAGHAPTWAPVYPAAAYIGTRQIALCVRAALPLALPLIEDHFPPDFRALHALPELRDAYAAIHAPTDEHAIAAATRRLAFDELFLLQLGMAIKRLHRLHDRPAPVLPCTQAIDAKVRARIPFQLTPAQNRVIAEIAADLAKPQPASRLIQGDVGSGKTVVALYAMLLAVAARRAAALMAPTEILAEQHFRTITAWLKGSSVRAALLHASLPRAQSREVRARLAAGQIDLVVGTHALIAGRTRLPNLALAVIDEQHRFGVHQRAALRAVTDGVPSTPHVLVMTATPIPRTLALTLFGDLDVSTIDALPPGRTPVTTRVVHASQRDQVYRFVRTRLDKGHRAFVVVPAIDTPQTTQNQDAHAHATQPPLTPASRPRSVHELARELSEGPLTGVRVGVMHGRLPPAERQAAMDDFRAGRTRVLIATTVIEVGVDVPEASVIVIEDADRFGLAQLHQLRGRVGRGSLPSVCVLVSPDNDALSHDRLLTLAQTSDGFRVAEKDLELRGFGDFFGAQQSGTSHFRVVSFPRDGDLLQLARRAAQQWAQQSPRLDRPGDALLRKRMLKLYGQWVRLGDIA